MVSTDPEDHTIAFDINALSLTSGWGSEMLWRIPHKAGLK